MRRLAFAAIFIATCAIAFGQMSVDEAMQRLKERQTTRTATTTSPTVDDYRAMIAERDKTIKLLSDSVNERDSTIKLISDSVAALKLANNSLTSRINAATVITDQDILNIKDLIGTGSDRVIAAMGTPSRTRTGERGDELYWSMPSGAFDLDCKVENGVVTSFFAIGAMFEHPNLLLEDPGHQSTSVIKTGMKRDEALKILGAPTIDTVREILTWDHTLKPGVDVTEMVKSHPYSAGHEIECTLKDGIVVNVQDFKSTN